MPDATPRAEAGLWCACEVRGRVLDKDRLPVELVLMAIAEETEPAVVRVRSWCGPETVRPSRGGKRLLVVLSSERSSSLYSAGVICPLGGSVDAGRGRAEGLEVVDNCFETAADPLINAG